MKITKVKTVPVKLSLKNTISAAIRLKQSLGCVLDYQRKPKGIGFTFGSDLIKSFRMNQIKTHKKFFQQQDYFEIILVY